MYILFLNDEITWICPCDGISLREKNLKMKVTLCNLAFDEIPVNRSC